jgi:DNA-binding beta-propeller fold protein YncE
VTLAGRADAQCTDHFILVSTSDFSTGSTSSLDPSDKTPSLNLESIHSDAVVRFGPGGLVYVVNRAGADNIQILDPCDNFNTVDQFSTGNGSGPHDIVFTSQTVAYVTRYDMTTLLKMNLQTGATLATINLAAFADADGIPEMDQMFFAGGTLCVLLQRLDRNNFYSPVGTSYLVKIDPVTDTVIPILGGSQPVALLRTNPYSEVNLGVFQGAGIAYFSAVAFFGLTDGAVLRVDLNDPTSQAIVITESAAGGDILDVEIISDTKGFAIVATPSFTTELIAFNPTTGTKIGATMYAPGGYNFNDVEPSPLGLLLTDRKPTDPGIRCFDMATNLQIPGGPVDVGLPPFDILVNDGSPVGVGDTPSSATRLGPNYPNPFNPSTSIPFTLAREGRVTLRIYDVNGRVVATLIDGAMTAGEHVAHWNASDARGLRVSSGVYMARLETDDATDTRKLVLLK